MKHGKRSRQPNLSVSSKKYLNYLPKEHLLRSLILLILFSALTLSLASCGRVDEFVKQRKAVDPGEYVLEVSESDDRITPELLKGSATLKVKDNKISGDYKVRYALVDTSNTVIVDKGKFSSDKLVEAFYPYSFDLNVEIDRQVFVGDVLIDREKLINKDSFRGTILDPSTGYGNFLAENTTTLNWEIDEIIK